MIEQFLEEYATFCGYDNLPVGEIKRRLCLDYKYTPANGRDFIAIAFGWMWGKCGDSVTATCQSAILQSAMNETYRQVAKENDWK